MKNVVQPDDTELAKAEPKTLRNRLLHLASRITRVRRRLRLRPDRTPALGDHACARPPTRDHTHVHALPQSFT